MRFSFVILILPLAHPPGLMRRVSRERVRPSDNTHHLVDALEVVPPAFLFPVSRFRVPAIFHNILEATHFAGQM